jgi:hypothetical protein
VWGTDVYTDDSPVCPAAVHAGVITPQRGGVVTFAIGAGQSSYKASTRHGVASKPFGEWQGSFSFVPSSSAGQIDWATSAKGLTPALGQAITLECPANGMSDRVYGTDTYTDDSSICTAAAHAGLVTPADGGRVTIEAVGAQAAFAASSRNGVESREYAAWPNAFRFASATLATTSRSSPAADPPPANTPTEPTPPASAPVVSASSSSAPTTPNGTAAARPGLRPAVAAANGNKAGSAVAASAALGAPSGVTVTPLGTGQVLVRWTPLSEAALYHIYYRKVGETQWAALTDRPGDQPATGSVYQSDPALVFLPAGLLEFEMVGARDADDWAGARSLPVRAVIPRYDGRYRVTLNGFRVNRETIDSPLNYDGQHDEIYVRVGVREYDADGNPRSSAQSVKTRTHGDVNAPRWKQGMPGFRFAAGNATGLGGLKTGNGFPDQVSPWVASGSVTAESFPLLVWEGYLREGDNTVAVTPVVYEDDESVGEMAPEKHALIVAGTWVGARGYEALQGYAATARPVLERTPLITPDVADLKTFLDLARSVEFRSHYAPQIYVSNMLQLQQQLTQQYGSLLQDVTAAASLLLNTKDRPIGMAGIEGGQVQFDPQIVRLSFESAEKFIATKQGSDPNVPAGIIPIRYQDTVPGGNGDYTLYLQITRIP